MILLFATQCSQRKLFDWKIKFKKNKALCDDFQIFESRVSMELPKIPELAAGRTETDVFPGVRVSSSVSQPHIITGICYEICCNRGNAWDQLTF
jgi:hypothetical protein